MNLARNIVLKENYSFVVMDSDGRIRDGEHGLYSYDTRYLNRLEWVFENDFQTLLAESVRPNAAVFHYSWIEGPSQVVGIQRELRLSDRILSDEIRIENTSPDPRVIGFRLEYACDFIDMFEARGFERLNHALPAVSILSGGVQLRYSGQEGFDLGLSLQSDNDTGIWSETSARWNIRLEPNESCSIRMKTAMDHPHYSEFSPVSYKEWEEGFPESARERCPGRYQEVLKQAVRDLRALVLFTPQGYVPAAGIPWFTAAFGRDSLITAYMCLPWYPQLAEGTLRYLALYQGKLFDPFRAEEPGKILHEIRWGELSHLKKVPHTPYYGTIDATPLFIILLHQVWKLFPDTPLVRELRDSWEAALEWMVVYGDYDTDGFLEYQGAEDGRGLVVQSWKDSNDSMTHEDGQLARGFICPVEVQGYAYRAFRAAVELYESLGDPERASAWASRAENLRDAFDRKFWIDSLGIHALALDGEKKPLRVKSSNAGQLLWSGIVPAERASVLVRTLFTRELFSGWGIRTLGTREVRYNPLSYHNGSVWPHDTALIADGLREYGFLAEARTLARALFDLAQTQSDKRLPELIGGYDRKEESPIPYPVACRPQAWDAAALLFLSGLL